MNSVKNESGARVMTPCFPKELKRTWTPTSVAPHLCEQHVIVQGTSPEFKALQEEYFTKLAQLALSTGKRMRFYRHLSGGGAEYYTDLVPSSSGELMIEHVDVWGLMNQVSGHLCTRLEGKERKAALDKARGTSKDYL